MKDEDLERLLRRYEPLAPPSSLRARVLGAPSNAKRAWPWAIAAAAMLGLSAGLGSSAERLMERQAVDVAARQRSIEVETLAEMVAGAESPRALAEWMIERRDADRALEGLPQALGVAGAGR